MTFRNYALGFLFAAAMTGAAGTVQAFTWTMEPQASTLEFTGTQTGREFRGQFRQFGADIFLDPEDLSTASIEVSVHIASFASGSPDRDSDALNVSWFNAASFPQATFTSRDVVALGEGRYVARGSLEIKGVAQEIELPFTLAIDGDSAVAEGSLSLKRLDFNVGNMDEDAEEELVGHGVDVRFHIQATKEN